MVQLPMLKMVSGPGAGKEKPLKGECLGPRDTCTGKKVLGRGKGRGGGKGRNGCKGRGRAQGAGRIRGKSQIGPG